MYVQVVFDSVLDTLCTLVFYSLPIIQSIVEQGTVADRHLEASACVATCIVMQVLSFPLLCIVSSLTDRKVSLLTAMSSLPVSSWYFVALLSYNGTVFYKKLVHEVWMDKEIHCTSVQWLCGMSN